jgi:hypothetical protein
MSGSSDKMLDLLQQLSVLNQLDSESRSDANSEAALLDSDGRRMKRQEIRAEMKQLASYSQQKTSK